VKRTIAVAIVLALVLSLALPAAALAKRGGVPAKGNGRGHTPAIVGGEDGGTGEGGATDPVSDPAPDKGKGKGKDKADKPQVAGDDSEDGEVGDEPARSEETTPPGWEVALSRLQANRARMEEKMAAGLRKSLPPGLLSAIAKFMERLGIEVPEPAPEPAPEPEPEAEPTPDPEPDPAPDPVEDPCTPPATEPLWVPML